jgi:hypothetical protein
MCTGVDFQIRPQNVDKHTVCHLGRCTNHALGSSSDTSVLYRSEILASHILFLSIPSTIKMKAFV